MSQICNLICPRIKGSIQIYTANKELCFQKKYSELFYKK